MHNINKLIKINVLISIFSFSCSNIESNKKVKSLEILNGLINVFDKKNIFDEDKKVKTQKNKNIDIKITNNKNNSYKKNIPNIKIYPNTDIEYIKQKTLDNTCGLCSAFNVLLRYKSKFDKNFKLPDCPEFLIYDVSPKDLYFTVLRKYNRIKPDIDLKQLKKLNKILGKDVREISDDFIDNDLNKIITNNQKEICEILEIEAPDNKIFNIALKIENIRDGFTKSDKIKIGGLSFKNMDNIIKNYFENENNYFKNMNPEEDSFKIMENFLFKPIESALKKIFAEANYNDKLKYAQDIIETSGGVSTYDHIQSLLRNYEFKTKELLNFKQDQQAIINNKKLFAIIASSGRHTVTFIRIDENKWQKVDGYSDRTDFKPMSIEQIFGSDYAKSTSQAIIIQKKINNISNGTDFIIYNLCQILYSACKM